MVETISSIALVALMIQLPKPGGKPLKFQVDLVPGALLCLIQTDYLWYIIQVDLIGSK